MYAGRDRHYKRRDRLCWSGDRHRERTGTGTAMEGAGKTKAARLVGARRAACADGAGTRVYEPVGGLSTGRGQAPPRKTKPQILKRYFGSIIGRQQK